MRSIILVVLLFFVHQLEADEAKGRKLQIGIKKRPAACEKKSKKGDVLSIHYRVSDPKPVVVSHLDFLFQGTLEESGAEFDNSYKRSTPLTFTLGMGQVIQGWDQV